MLTEKEILDALDYSNDGAYERLGFNPRGGDVELEIYYYSNCLINLTQHRCSLKRITL